jgi:hypothetical protein
LASARRAGLDSLGKSFSEGFGPGDFIVPRVQPTPRRPAACHNQTADRTIQE